MYPLAPSFFATVLTGISIGAILLYLYTKGLRSMTTAQIATLATLLGILIGIHGVLHLGLEWKYDYNPLRNLSG
jgi:Ni/Fe-hydrogenase subunit HybB-like protein